MKQPASGYKGISRIDSDEKNTHGWYVRVCFDRKMHTKFINDATNGGKDKALRKAVKFRNELEKQLGKPRTDRIVVVSNERNQTGILGVQRVIKYPSKNPDRPLRGMVYEVTWSPEPNALRKACFSIEKLGEELAFQKAVEYRQKVEKKIYGRVVQTEVPPFEQVKARLDAIQLKRKRARKKVVATRPN